MKIGFIGAGKVGTAFGGYLFSKGCEISGYLGRSQQAPERACRKTNSQVFPDSASLIQSSQLIFITTQDDQIETVAKQITDNHQDLSHKYFAHMSGALSSAVLSGLAQSGAHIYSLHPMQSFADIDKAVADLSHTYFGLEGQEKMEIITQLLEKTGNPFILLQSNQKTRYHIAACTVSNYLTAVLDFGLEMMLSIGIEKPEAYNALLPMINGTIGNIKNLGPEQALTGPIVRGDINTIKNHLPALSDPDSKEMETYRQLGRLTLKLAEKGNLKNSQQQAELKRILSR